MKTVAPARKHSTSIVAMTTGLSLLLASCQSASTSEPPTTRPPFSSASLAADPRPVVVRDFEFDATRLHTDRGLLSGREGPVGRIEGQLHAEEPPARKAMRLAEILAETIATELTTRKIPASRQPEGAPLPDDGLLVTGRFLEVDEGSRLRRATVGFGSGSDEVLVQVSVYDLARSSDEPILVYGTGTGSKPRPGAVASMNPYTMAAKYVLSRNATEKDVRQLGKRIAGDLVQIEAGGDPPPDP